jgi:hypothetical protein
MPITVGSADTTGSGNGAAGWTSITPQQDSAWAGLYPAAWALHQGSAYTSGYQGPASSVASASGGGTRFVFVDSPSSRGGTAASDDSGTGTLANPKCNMDGNAIGNPGGHLAGYIVTGAGALTLMRNGYPDWMCLKNGQTYSYSNMPNYWSVSGPTIVGFNSTTRTSTSTPMLLGGFDWTASMLPPVPNPGTGGAHPILDAVAVTSPSTGFSTVPYSPNDSMLTGSDNVTVDNFVVIGVNFSPLGADPNNYANPPYPPFFGTFNSYFLTRCPSGRQFLLIEDCQFYNIGSGPQWGIAASEDNYVMVRRCQMCFCVNSGLFGPVALNAIIEENFIRHNGWSEIIPGYSATAVNHNFYRGSVGLDNASNTVANPCHEYGNILAEVGDNDGGRAGVIATNNLWVRYVHALHNLGVQQTSIRAKVDNCVFTDGRLAGYGVQLAGQNTNSAYFQGEYFNMNGADITNNLFIHYPPSANPVWLANGIDGCVVTNNIVFDSSGAAFTQVTGAVKAAGAPHFKSGAITGYTYSGGSGYTNSTTLSASAAYDATAIGVNPGASPTGTAFGVANSSIAGTFNHLWVKTSGRTPSDVSDLYFCTGNWNASYVHVPELPFTNNCTATFYIPYWSVQMQNAGANGTLTCDVVVGSCANGVVNSVNLNTSQNHNTGYVSIASNGSGYSAGDTLTTSFSTMGAGTGFQITLNALSSISLCSNTIDGTNLLYGNLSSNPFGSSVWADPSRSALKYAQTQLGLNSGNSSTDYNNMFNAIGANQTTPTWKSSLTAIAINNWIRAGFGVSTSSGSSGVVIAGTVSIASQYGQYRGRTTKIPHA